MDYLAQHSSVEYTTDGFEYAVFDPEALTGTPTSVVLGSLIYRPDEIEMRLFLGEDMPPDVRASIADICIASADDYSRFGIARAGDELLAAQSGQSDEEWQKTQQVLYHIRQNMRAHQQGLMLSNQAGERVDPLIRETLHSTLGWVALRRGLSDAGNDAYDRLCNDGLWIPGFDSEQRVVGLIRNKKGEVKVAGFLYMEEKSERHHCADCSGQILRGTNRITLQYEQPDSYSDHHHFHATCFLDSMLPRFDQSTLSIDINPHAQT